MITIQITENYKYSFDGLNPTVFEKDQVITNPSQQVLDVLGDRYVEIDPDDEIDLELDDPEETVEPVDKVEEVEQVEEPQNPEDEIEVG